MGRALSASSRLADVVCSAHPAGECAMVFAARSAASRRFTRCFESSREESLSREASASSSSLSLRLSLHGYIDPSCHEGGLDPAIPGSLFPASQPEEIIQQLPFKSLKKGHIIVCVTKFSSAVSTALIWLRDRSGVQSTVSRSTPWHCPGSVCVSFSPHHSADSKLTARQRYRPLSERGSAPDQNPIRKSCS